MTYLEEIFEKTIIDRDTHFHILRHFQKVDDDFIKNFCKESNYTSEDVQQQMEKAGSKFNYAFAENPEELIKNLSIEIEYKSFYISSEDNRMDVFIEFDKAVYPEGIGFDGIIAERNLAAGERKDLEKTERDGFTIYVLKTDRKRTWRLNLILYQKEDQYLIGTFFPGTHAPPFPNKDMHTNEQIKEYREFWSQHILIQ